MHPFEQALWALKKKIRENSNYAERIYCAMCNTAWKSIEDPEVKIFVCFWREAAELVSRIRHHGNENYLNFYCCGYRRTDGISEGIVDSEVREDLKKLGFEPRPIGEVNL